MTSNLALAKVRCVILWQRSNVSCRSKGLNKYVLLILFHLVTDFMKGSLVQIK